MKKRINCIPVGFSFSPEDIERGFRALDSNIDGSLEPNEVFVLYDSIDIDGKVVIFQH